VTAAPGEEIVDLIDERDEVIGRATRSRVRSEVLLHREVAAMVRNRRGELYVHRRTQTKDIHPGLYDMFVAGVVSSGEGYREAIRRELSEELAIRASDPGLLFMHRYHGSDNNFRAAIFEVEWNGPIRQQPEEIAWGAFVSGPRMRTLLERWTFVPDGLEVYARYLEQCAPRSP